MRGGNVPKHVSFKACVTVTIHCAVNMNDALNCAACLDKSVFLKVIRLFPESLFHLPDEKNGEEIPLT